MRIAYAAMSSEALVRAEESKYRSAGLAAIAGAILALAGFLLLRVAIGGGVTFEGLENAHDNSAVAWLSGACSLLGYSLLSIPLYRLFRFVQARSPRIRGQLVGLVIMGPLLVGLSGMLVAAGTQEAADTYLNGEVELTSSEVRDVREECDDELREKGKQDFADEFDEGSSPAAACNAKKLKEKEGTEAIQGASLVTVGSFLGFAGALALIFALFYTGLWSMRTGLLTRFWGSLGMAVGIAFVLGLSPLLFLWFAYLGCVFLGIVPGGRPPAWAAGEAVPWPTPGERAAAGLERSDPDGDSDVVEGDAEELPDPEAGPGGEPPKKRKKRE